MGRRRRRRRRRRRIRRRRIKEEEEYEEEDEEEDEEEEEVGLMAINNSAATISASRLYHIFDGNDYDITQTGYGCSTSQPSNTGMKGFEGHTKMFLICSLMRNEDQNDFLSAGSVV